MADNGLGLREDIDILESHSVRLSMNVWLDTCDGDLNNQHVNAILGI